MSTFVHKLLHGQQNLMKGLNFKIFPIHLFCLLLVLQSYFILLPALVNVNKKFVFNTPLESVGINKFLCVVELTYFTCFKS